MDSNKKNTVKEPSEVYETSSHVDANAQELHPILIKLIKKSKKNHDEGNVFSHEEMMQRVKSKYPFLK